MTLGTALLAAVLVAGSFRAGAAEERPTPLRIGARVRIVQKHSKQLAGTLLAIDDTGLTVEGRGSVRTSVPVADVKRLEVFRGSRAITYPAAAVGALVSALVFAKLGESSYSSAGAPAGIVAIGGLLGAGVGAAIGHQVKTDRWQSVPLAKVQVSVAPVVRTGTAGVTFVARFR
jgi:hypothetical protein